MPPDEPDPNNLRAVYSAIANYHNTVVGMRFVVAGLFLAANGALASGFFQACPASRSWFVPILGMWMAMVCY